MSSHPVLKSLLAAVLLLLGCAAVTAQTDPADAGGDGGESITQNWIYTHAILMSVGWVGLLPRERGEFIDI